MAMLVITRWYIHYFPILSHYQIHRIPIHLFLRKMCQNASQVEVRTRTLSASAKVLGTLKDSSYLIYIQWLVVYYIYTYLYYIYIELSMIYIYIYTYIYILWYIELLVICIYIYYIEELFMGVRVSTNYKPTNITRGARFFFWFCRSGTLSFRAWAPWNIFSERFCFPSGLFINGL